MRWLIIGYIRKENKIKKIKTLINSIVDFWEEDTCLLSYHDPKHPAFSIVKKIADNDKYDYFVISTILERMEKERTWFFTILMHIVPVKDQPVIPKKFAGNIKEQTKIWINWGYEREYLK